MSGWFDDWSSGRVDCLTAFNGWLDAEKSPSEKADDHCGYSESEYSSCKQKVIKEESRKSMDKYGL